MDKITQRTRTALHIERMPHGGYVVSEAHRDYCSYAQQLAACTDIDDALAFIKDELGEPEIVAKLTDADAAKLKDEMGRTPGNTIPIQLTEAERAALAREKTKPAEVFHACPHCGIPEGIVRDERCTGACTTGRKPYGGVV